MTDTLSSSDSEAIENERNWLALAVAGGIILIVVSGFVAFWVFAAASDIAKLTRVQIAAPFAVLAVAAITFMTVVWRGLISARQANTGLRQLDGLQRQIAMTEESGLATLLQKGAELLAEDKPAKVSAGIASLHAVASSLSTTFTDPGRRLLADYVQEHGTHSHADSLVRQAAEALRSSYFAHEIPLARDLHFEEEDQVVIDQDYSADWIFIEGITSLTYIGGNFRRQQITDREGCRVTFIRTRFSNCWFESLYSYEFIECEFDRCKFGLVRVYDLTTHEFTNCDFKGTVIVMDDAMPDMRSGGNHYDVKLPPETKLYDGEPIDWSAFLLKEDQWLWKAALGELGESDVGGAHR